MRASLLRRSPFLLLVVALMTLAVLFAPGAQPAQAQQSFWSATLTPANQGTDVAGCIHIGNTRCGLTSLLTEDEFTYGGASYTIQQVLLSSGTLIFTLNKAVPDSLKNSGVALVVDGTSFAFTDATRTTGLNTNDRLTWDDSSLSWTVGTAVSLSLQEPVTMTAEFADGVTIPDKTYTAGADVIQAHTGAHDQGLTRLPEPTVTFGVDEGKGQYKVAYTATDLPAGLTLGSDRVIRGVPTSATSGAVTVTYTATVTFYPNVERAEEGEEQVFPEALGTATASLTFDVTVNPPVTWSAEAQKFFAANAVVYTGSAWRNNTLPEAQGGTGTLTYSLIENTSGQPLADHVSSITFDASTRRVGGTVAEGARYAVTYVATDQNGATAQGYTDVRHGVGGL